MATFVNVEDYQELQKVIGGLRKDLTQRLAGPLLRDPALARELNRRTDEALDAFLGALSVGTPPDLGLAQLVGLGPDAATDFADTVSSSGVVPYDETVTPERILAIADMYYIYNVLDRCGVHRAIRTLQDLFRAGAVRLSADTGAFALYQFDKRDVLRFTTTDRLAAYLRTFGYGSGPLAPGARPNTAFHGLFENFMTAVSRYFADKRFADAFRSGPDVPSFGSIAVVRRAGLDLRANLRWASYGHLAVLAVELMQVLEDAFRILGAGDVRALFGAETPWDVVEEVLTRYHNETLVTSPRQRMGEAGKEVLGWLAHGHVLEEDRVQFEALLEDIADHAEEWLTSARSVGVASDSGPDPRRQWTSASGMSGYGMPPRAPMPADGRRAYAAAAPGFPPDGLRGWRGGSS